VGAGVPDLQKGRFESIEHEVVVLQILKIRNISAPKANESSKTAPKLLKVQLTDGVNTLSAIEMESTSLSIETKPGTKVSRKILLGVIDLSLHFPTPPRFSHRLDCGENQANENGKRTAPLHAEEHRNPRWLRRSFGVEVGSFKVARGNERCVFVG
jgi:hypothetical protein